MSKRHHNQRKRKRKTLRTLAKLAEQSSYFSNQVERMENHAEANATQEEKDRRLKGGLGNNPARGPLPRNQGKGVPEREGNRANGATDGEATGLGGGT